MGRKNVRKTFKKTSRNFKLKSSKSFTKKVQKIIHKDVETKEASTVFNPTDFNGLVNNVADVCRIMPAVTLGTAAGFRIGDQIQGQRLRIQGHMMINIVPNTSGALIPTAIPSTCRMMIRAFICSVKKYGNYDDVSTTTAWMSKFLKNGSLTQSLDGTVQSMYLPVNTDVITVHKEIKKYVTIPAIYAQTSTSAGFSNTAVGFEQSCKFFNVNINCKKVMKYEDTSNSPQNFAPFLVISYAKLDGTSADILVSRVTAAYVSTLFYEDA